MEAMRWELWEKYIEQDAKFLEVQARYDKAVKDAGTRLADLKAEQEALLREEFRTGTDLSTQKAKVRAKIEEAEKAKATAELERAQAYAYVSDASAADRITVRDLVLDWNGPYCTAVRDAEFTPIKERMVAAREDYYNAVLDYYEFKNRYSTMRSDLWHMNFKDNDNHPGNHMSVCEVADVSELPMIADRDLYHIRERKQLPNGFKRTGGSK